MVHHGRRSSRAHASLRGSDHDRCQQDKSADDAQNVLHHRVVPLSFSFFNSQIAERRSSGRNRCCDTCETNCSQRHTDLQLVFHPATTGARWSAARHASEPGGLGPVQRGWARRDGQKEIAWNTGVAGRTPLDAEVTFVARFSALALKGQSFRRVGPRSSPARCPIVRRGVPRQNCCRALFHGTGAVTARLCQGRRPVIAAALGPGFAGQAPEPKLFAGKLSLGQVWAFAAFARGWLARLFCQEPRKCAESRRRTKHAKCQCPPFGPTAP